MHERFPGFGTSGPFARRIVVTGVALTLLFAAMAPESSAPLTLVPRLLFWGLHIGLGLAAVAIAAGVLMRHVAGWRDWRFIVLSGLAGVVLFAPIAYGLEMLFPVPAGAPDTDWADRFAQTSLFAAIAVEAFELAPSFLAAWVVINLGPFGEALRQTRALEQRTSIPSADSADPAAAPNAPEDHAESVDRPQAIESQMEKTSRPSHGSQSQIPFLDRLPPAIGRDIVSVSSDLHYLHVTTRDGQAMLLGALKEVEDAFGESGLRVHRSHWVSVDAVTRLHKSSDGWHIELRGGHRVPVSRRKRNDVAARLGEDFVRAAAAP